MKIKTANLDEIQLMISWAASEGWNPGLQDAYSYHLADTGGFFVGYQDSQMVACISAVKYGAFGFIGFYMVKPEYRGHGLGLKIWQHGVKYLHGCNMALDGVVEQQHNYRKSGFKWAHNNIRYQWQHKPQTIQNNISVTYDDCDPEQLDNYLADFFPAKRPHFNHQWQRQNNASARVILNNDVILGYGVIRACLEGYKVGPLFASSAELALQLLDDLSSEVESGQNIYLDVPEVNTAANALIENKMAQAVFATARMYSQAKPNIKLSETFGITSFEIG